jgi:hypothetical protein
LKERSDAQRDVNRLCLALVPRHSIFSDGAVGFKSHHLSEFQLLSPFSTKDAKESDTNESKH